MTTKINSALTNLRSARTAYDTARGLEKEDPLANPFDLDRRSLEKADELAKAVAAYDKATTDENEVRGVTHNFLEKLAGDRAKYVVATRKGSDRKELLAYIEHRGVIVSTDAYDDHGVFIYMTTPEDLTYTVERLRSGLWGAYAYETCAEAVNGAVNATFRKGA